jgi:S-DNA-T family DNA segregation ATPase FtsK/SpoIIIE
LVAGEPKAGKSSFERTIGLSICMSKYDVDLHLIDFQGIELGIFQDCKKVKTYGETPEDFDKLMDLLGKESEERLKLFASVKKKHFIQNLAVWNKFYPERALPYKIILIDEFSRISENEDLLNKFRIRVAMDRKAGILYVASMQRPDVKIISGSIKGNMPTRVAFKTVTDTDSEVILDVEGAEKIKNRGRCIMKYCGTLQEVQVLYIEPDDVREYFKKYKLQKTEEDLQIERKIEMATRQKHCVNPYRKPECFAIDDKVIIISGECKGCKGTFVDAIAGRDGCNLKVHLYETLNGKAIDKTINCSETDLTHLYV